MTSYINLPEKLLHKLPENVSYFEGALIEPASTVTHAILERGKISPGDFVVVIGPGPIGLIAAQVAKAYGAKKVADAGISIDKEYRLKIAKELDIDYVINAEEIDLKDFVLSRTNNYGADMVVECSGSEVGINLSIELLSKNGKLAAMGMSGNEYLNIKWNMAISKEISVCTSLSSTYNSWESAISLLKEGKLNLLKLISHKFPLSEYREGFNLFIQKKGLKILLIPDEEFRRIDV